MKKRDNIKRKSIAQATFQRAVSYVLALALAVCGFASNLKNAQDAYKCAYNRNQIQEAFEEHEAYVRLCEHLSEFYPGSLESRFRTNIALFNPYDEGKTLADAKKEAQSWLGNFNLNMDFDGMTYVDSNGKVITLAEANNLYLGVMSKYDTGMTISDDEMMQARHAVYTMQVILLCEYVGIDLGIPVSNITPRSMDHQNFRLFYLEYSLPNGVTGEYDKGYNSDYDVETLFLGNVVEEMLELKDPYGSFSVSDLKNAYSIACGMVDEVADMRAFDYLSIVEERDDRREQRNKAADIDYKSKNKSLILRK